MARQRSNLWQDLLALVVISWVVAGVFFLLMWRDSVAAERVRIARTCAAGETFTPASCRATLNAAAVSLTNDHIEFEVDGRRMSMKTQVAGEVSDRAGTAIQVTFYAGKPIRVEGPSLRIDVPDSPVRNTENDLNRGLFFLIGLPAIATLGTFIRSAIKKL
jgi:hypothetical protein